MEEEEEEEEDCEVKGVRNRELERKTRTERDGWRRAGEQN